jgi:co-chaperonin GroES (HSP10)
MQFTPANQHLIVKAISEDVSASGLSIPKADHDKRPFYGEIIAMRDGAESKDGVKFAVGNIVAFDRFEAHQFDIREEQFFGILEERVICIVTL